MIELNTDLYTYKSGKNLSFDTRAFKRGSRLTILAGTSLCILFSSIVPPAAMAISIPGKSKKTDFKLPANDKLDDEYIAEDPATSNTDSENNPSEITDKIDLSPLTLDSADDAVPGNDNESIETSDNSDEFLNAGVSTTDFIPKGPLEGSDELLAPTSVKGSTAKEVDNLGSSLLDQAKSVNLSPLPLQESAEEFGSKLDKAREIEREQLTALWESTLTRSPDINFVIQKLMPATDHAKVTTVMMRALSTAMIGALGAVGTIAPGPGMVAGQQTGYAIMSQILAIQDSKAQKKARVTQTEAIMLYNMIRSTADRLVECYRNYKNQHEHVYKTNADLEDLKNMAKNLDLKSSAEELKSIYTLRQAQRDADKEGAELTKLRQILVDLAGPEAIANLDKEIDSEFRELHPELFLNNMIASETGEDETVAEEPQEEIAAKPPSNSSKNKSVDMSLVNAITGMVNGQMSSDEKEKTDKKSKKKKSSSIENEPETQLATKKESSTL